MLGVTIKVLNAYLYFYINQRSLKEGTTNFLTGKERVNDSLLLINIQKHLTLDLSDKKLITSLFSIQEFRKKQLLLNQGQICKSLFFVERGSLRAFNINEAAKESTIMFAIQDWWITDMNSFLNQKPALVAVQALEDSSVLALDFESFESLLEKKPKFERYFRILFQKAYVREQQRALDAISMTTEDRYNRFVSKYPQIVERVNQKQIASYLGITPEFLSSIKRKEAAS